MEGRRAQIRLSARQVAKNVSYTGGFLGMLTYSKAVLGYTPYRLHKNADGTFVIPILVYDGKVYVLDDVVMR